MRALAFEHLASDPVGVFGEVLTERGIAVDRVLLYEGEPVPDWRGYDFVIAMGAGASVWDEEEYPWIVDEKRAVREAVLAGVPYFGVCFGVQLLADVFGARSFRGPEPEIGVNQVFLTPAARHDPVFRGFPADLEVCEWHSNHFSLPPGAIRLARSPRYENQAIRYGRVAYGLQSHLEPRSRTSVTGCRSFGDRVLFEKRHGEGAVARACSTTTPSSFRSCRRREGSSSVGGCRTRSAFGTAPFRRGTEAERPRVPTGDAGFVGRDGELARSTPGSPPPARRERGAVVLRGDSGTARRRCSRAAAAPSPGAPVLGPRGEAVGHGRRVPVRRTRRPVPPDRRASSRARAPTGPPPSISSWSGHSGAPIRDRFAVYAGDFDLLVSAAGETPLLLLVDDAHLVDDGSREAIGFIARRLGGTASRCSSPPSRRTSSPSPRRPARSARAAGRALPAQSAMDGRARPPSPKRWSTPRPGIHSRCASCPVTSPAPSGVERRWSRVLSRRRSNGRS